MKKLYFFLLLFSFSVPNFGQDTFSIIAVDPNTGEIGAAGATCVDGIAQWGGIQLLNKIIPGKGGVNAQAWICLNPHINLDNAISQMQIGSSPDEIIDWLYTNDACAAQGFNPEYRQYGVVDLDDDGNPRTAAFTGASADDFKGHRTGDTYAIQGNILLGPEVLDGMENGYNNAGGTLAHKLMAAMQGANMPGADQRCLARGTSSTSAFLRVYKPDDNIGTPYLELSILEMPFGEEPIDSLQNLFDTWWATSTHSIFVENEIQVNVFPNPAKDILQVAFDMEGETELEFNILNVTGASTIQSSEKVFNGFQKELDIEDLPNGLYYLQLKSPTGASKTIKFIKQ